MIKQLRPPIESDRYLNEFSQDIIKRRATFAQTTDIRNLNVGYLGNALYLGRNFLGESIAIGTAPTLIKSNPISRPYLFLNPSKSIGLSTSAIIQNGAVIASGNSQSVPAGVAGYKDAHVFINISAITGNWDLIMQAQDPTSLIWIDTQTLFLAQAATTSRYYYIGANGIPTDLAFRWIQNVGATAMTLSITVVLKDGLGGSGAGLSQTIYLGGENVTTTTGYPLLEGREQAFILGENVNLYGVAFVNTNLSVFSL